MDITQIKSALVESVNETVPAIVEASVKAETASLSQKIVDVETQMKEIATQAKFGGENATKELHSVTAKYFKSMVRKSADFAEAKTKFLNIGTDADG